MAVTSDAQAHGEQDAVAGPAAQRDGAPEHADQPCQPDQPDNEALTVFQTAAWIPPAYRQAYLEGAASVLARGRGARAGARSGAGACAPAAPRG